MNGQFTRKPVEGEWKKTTNPLFLRRRPRRKKELGMCQPTSLQGETFVTGLSCVSRSFKDLQTTEFQKFFLRVKE